MPAWARATQRRSHPIIRMDGMEGFTAPEKRPALRHPAGGAMAETSAPQRAYGGQPRRSGVSFS